MSFFGKFFGGKPKPQKQSGVREPTLAKLPPIKVSQTETTPVDPANDKNLIKVFDAYGREMFITKEDWRTKVLPGTIESNWRNPDQLYGIIFDALNDGMRSDVVAAAEQLYKIDPQPDRGTCVWGIVLKDENRLDEAEKVFRGYITKHGENGSILTNLAKIYSRRKNDKQAEEILWHALEIDPNQDNGLGWYLAIHRERSGEEGGKEALRRISALPGSWRAQLWLGRAALASRNLETALAYYHQSLACITNPVPTDILMQMSGDLGNFGHLPELLQLTEPHFIAETHGLQVGNNLIKAHIDLGQLDAARRILNQLYALKRPDWQQNLSFWDTEIAKTRVQTTVLDDKPPPQIAMLSIEGPVWLKPLSPAVELFPVKQTDGPTVCFIGSSANVATNSKRIIHQLSDSAGRLSRALPLFLAEQVVFGSDAKVLTLVPWIIGQPSGFVFSGVRSRDEDAANNARQGQIKSDYVVISHLNPLAEPWTVELRLVRTIDGKFLGELNASFPLTKPQDGIPQLARRLLTMLAEHAEVASSLSPPIYQVPSGEQFAYYLLRLEQLLAVRCGTMDGVSPEFLSGEREIINGNLQLCLACPDNVSTRLLLAQTLLAMNKIRPDIPPEFKNKIALLQKEKPLLKPAQDVLQRLLNEILAP